MCDYAKYYCLKESFNESLSSRLRDAEEAFPRENNSAIHIQKAFRGYHTRLEKYLKSLAANEIQRVFRGFIGKVIAINETRKKLQMRKDSLLVYFAVLIQRYFRGFYSRKYKFNFAKRKKEIETIIQRGIDIREVMINYSMEQKEAMLTEEKANKKKKLKECAATLHHLVSTGHIRGIYNPHPDFLEVPCLEDIPVEDHIRITTKDLFKTRGIAKRGLVTDLNGTKRVPLKGLFSRLSLQASAPYDALHKEKLKEISLERIISKEKGRYFAGGKTTIIDNNIISCRAQESYIDTWNNPMTTRGVPRNQEELLESCRLGKPLFTLRTDKPFYTKTGGNKSTVLPNDLFDVIADAESFGGAARRHLGTGRTVRFGIPDNVDKRGESILQISLPRIDTDKRSFKEYHSSTKESRIKRISVAIPIDYDSSDDDDSDANFGL